MGTRAFRTAAHSVTLAELDAINAIRTAYLACNAAGGPLEWEITPGTNYGGHPTAMGHLAEAARVAWLQVGITDVDLWAVMLDSGEDAAYALGLYGNSEYDLRSSFPAR